jgi:hypothetical protein
MSFSAIPYSICRMRVGSASLQPWLPPCWEKPVISLNPLARCSLLEGGLQSVVVRDALARDIADTAQIGKQRVKRT